MTARYQLPSGISGATEEYRTRVLQAGTSPHRPARDAASLVILDDSGREPHILMGRRGGGLSWRAR